MQTIGILGTGLRHNDVTSRLGFAHIKITRLLGRYRARGSADNRPWSGRPRVATPDHDRHILTSHLRNRFYPLL